MIDPVIRSTSDDLMETKEGCAIPTWLQRANARAEKLLAFASRQDKRVLAGEF